MTRFVAFLGGINVGGHRVTMDRLRGEFSELGFSDVETVIASGNVLFSGAGSAGLESRIEQHLGNQLGWPVPTFVRRATDVVAIVEYAAAQPFGEIPDSHTYMVALTAAHIAAAHAATIVGSSSPLNRFQVQGREVHWAIAGKLSQSEITLPKLNKLIGRNTTRNITSLRRLADRL